MRETASSPSAVGSGTTEIDSIRKRLSGAKMSVRDESSTGSEAHAGLTDDASIMGRFATASGMVKSCTTPNTV